MSLYRSSPLFSFFHIFSHICFKLFSHWYWFIQCSVLLRFVLHLHVSQSLDIAIDDSSLHAIPSRNIFALSYYIRESHQLFFSTCTYFKPTLQHVSKGFKISSIFSGVVFIFDFFMTKLLSALFNLHSFYICKSVSTIPVFTSFRQFPPIISSQNHNSKFNQPWTMLNIPRAKSYNTFNSGAFRNHKTVQGSSEYWTFFTKRLQIT